MRDHVKALCVFGHAKSILGQREAAPPSVTQHGRGRSREPPSSLDGSRLLIDDVVAARFKQQREVLVHSGLAPPSPATALAGAQDSVIEALAPGRRGTVAFQSHSGQGHRSRRRRPTPCPALGRGQAATNAVVLGAAASERVGFGEALGVGRAAAANGTGACDLVRTAGKHQPGQPAARRGGVPRDAAGVDSVDDADVLGKHVAKMVVADATSGSL